jgi:hypothetical protein
VQGKCRPGGGQPGCGNEANRHRLPRWSDTPAVKSASWCALCRD